MMVWAWKPYPDSCHAIRAAESNMTPVSNGFPVHSDVISLTGASDNHQCSIILDTDRASSAGAARDGEVSLADILRLQRKMEMSPATRSMDAELLRLLFWTILG